MSGFGGRWVLAIRSSVPRRRHEHAGARLTSTAIASIRAPVAAARDLVELAKPRLSLLVVFTAGCGLALAPGSLGPVRAALFILGTALLVASANTLNCWMEIEGDRRMARTRARPLPSGRLDPWVAFAFGAVLGLYAIPLLAIAANPLTALLGAIAHVVYVLVYTPLKRVSPLALEVGAVPGALPPLMGWTAVAGEPGLGGWVLFAVLFAWQLPHFLAASLYLEDDYRRGGFRVLPVVKGEASARRHLLAYTVLLLAVSAAPFATGMAGSRYAAAAASLGAVFVALAAAGLRGRCGRAWARRVFLYSILYLPALATVLVLDGR